jgi:hypothetical protein
MDSYRTRHFTGSYNFTKCQQAEQPHLPPCTHQTAQSPIQRKVTMANEARNDDDDASYVYATTGISTPKTPEVACHVSTRPNSWPLPVSERRAGGCGGFVYLGESVTGESITSPHGPLLPPLLPSSLTKESPKLVDTSAAISVRLPMRASSCFERGLLLDYYCSNATTLDEHDDMPPLTPCKGYSVAKMETIHSFERENSHEDEDCMPRSSTMREGTGHRPLPMLDMDETEDKTSSEDDSITASFIRHKPNRHHPRLEMRSRKQARCDSGLIHCQSLNQPFDVVSF